MTLDYWLSWYPSIRWLIPQADRDTTDAAVAAIKADEPLMTQGLPLIMDAWPLVQKLIPMIQPMLPVLEKLIPLVEKLLPIANKALTVNKPLFDKLSGLVAHHQKMGMSHDEAVSHMMDKLSSPDLLTPPITKS